MQRTCCDICERDLTGLKQFCFLLYDDTDDRETDSGHLCRGCHVELSRKIKFGRRDKRIR